MTSLALFVAGVLVGVVVGFLLSCVWFVAAIQRGIKAQHPSACIGQSPSGHYLRSDRFGASTREPNPPMQTGEPRGWAN